MESSFYKLRFLEKQLCKTPYVKNTIYLNEINDILNERLRFCLDIMIETSNTKETSLQFAELKLFLDHAKMIDILLKSKDSFDNNETQFEKLILNTLESIFLVHWKVSLVPDIVNIILDFIDYLDENYINIFKDRILSYFSTPDDCSEYFMVILQKVHSFLMYKDTFLCEIMDIYINMLETLSVELYCSFLVFLKNDFLVFSYDNIKFENKFEIILLHQLTEEENYYHPLVIHHWFYLFFLSYQSHCEDLIQFPFKFIKTCIHNMSLLNINEQALINIFHCSQDDNCLLYMVQTLIKYCCESDDIDIGDMYDSQSVSYYLKELIVKLVASTTCVYEQLFTSVISMISSTSTQYLSKYIMILLEIYQLSFTPSLSNSSSDIFTKQIKEILLTHQSVLYHHGYILKILSMNSNSVLLLQDILIILLETHKTSYDNNIQYIQPFLHHFDIFSDKNQKTIIDYLTSQFVDPEQIPIELYIYLFNESKDFSNNLILQLSTVLSNYLQPYFNINIPLISQSIQSQLQVNSKQTNLSLSKLICSYKYFDQTNYLFSLDIGYLVLILFIFQFRQNENQQESVLENILSSIFFSTSNQNHHVNKFVGLDYLLILIDWLHHDYRSQEHHINTIDFKAFYIFMFMLSQRLLHLLFYFKDTIVVTSSTSSRIQLAINYYQLKSYIFLKIISILDKSPKTFHDVQTDSIKYLLFHRCINIEEPVISLNNKGEINVPQDQFDALDDRLARYDKQISYPMRYLQDYFLEKVNFIVKSLVTLNWIDIMSKDIKLSDLSSNLVSFDLTLSIEQWEAEIITLSHTCFEITRSLKLYNHESRLSSFFTLLFYFFHFYRVCLSYDGYPMFCQYFKNLSKYLSDQNNSSSNIRPSRSKANLRSSSSKRLKDYTKDSVSKLFSYFSLEKNQESDSFSINSMTQFSSGINLSQINIIREDGELCSLSEAKRDTSSPQSITLITDFITQLRVSNNIPKSELLQVKFNDFTSQLRFEWLLLLYYAVNHLTNTFELDSIQCDHLELVFQMIDFLSREVIQSIMKEITLREFKLVIEILSLFGKYFQSFLFTDFSHNHISELYLKAQSLFLSTSIRLLCSLKYLTSSIPASLITTIFQSALVFCPLSHQKVIVVILLRELIGKYADIPSTITPSFDDSDSQPDSYGPQDDNNNSHDDHEEKIHTLVDKIISVFSHELSIDEIQDSFTNVVIIGHDDSKMRVNLVTNMILYYFTESKTFDFLSHNSQVTIEQIKLLKVQKQFFVDGLYLLLQNLNSLMISTFGLSELHEESILLPSLYNLELKWVYNYLTLVNKIMKYLIDESKEVFENTNLLDSYHNDKLGQNLFIYSRLPYLYVFVGLFIEENLNPRFELLLTTRSLLKILQNNYDTLSLYLTSGVEKYLGSCLNYWKSFINKLKEIQKEIEKSDDLISSEAGLVCLLINIEHFLDKNDSLDNQSLKDNDSTKSSSPKKRSRQSSPKKKAEKAFSRKKRNRLRSRNNIVDSWLSDEEGSDAYEDLEDFLVLEGEEE